ncbi:hypothetical protein AB5I41_16425 [Sphingomonas sp. MMS24-JH45]
MRVSRKKSPISVAAVRRVLDAASKAGSTVAHVEVQPDGTIRLSAGGSPEPVSPTADDIFSARESPASYPGRPLLPGSASPTVSAAGTSMPGAEGRSSCRRMGAQAIADDGSGAGRGSRPRGESGMRLARLVRRSRH